jgi:prepilin-type N-terminal cleavage/methylation domain-containing protein
LRRNPLTLAYLKNSFRGFGGGLEHKTQYGFSFVELLAVIAVLSVLFAIALPAWNKLLPSFQLDSSVRQVQTELQYIKMRAASENIGFQLEYGTDSGNYTINKNGTPYVSKPLPQGIKISHAGTIAYSPRGTAGANRVRLRSPDGWCKQVVVSSTGRVRVCQPLSCAEDC